MPLSTAQRLTPTRFPGGINNVQPYQSTAFLGMPDPTRFHTYMNDFDTYLASDWTVTKVGTGTQALTAGNGGLLLNTNTTGVSDSIMNQLTVATFAPVAGKRTFFRARFKVSDATLSQLIFGLVNATTTPLTNTDGIFFQKPAAVATIDVYVEKDATTGRNTTAAVGTLVADTFVTLGFHYDGYALTEFFIDDVIVKKLDSTATYLPDANLALTFGYANTTGVANTMTLDYVMVAQER